MGFEDSEQGEKSRGFRVSGSFNMTLDRAVELGEYSPDFLSIFPEWLTLSRYVQFQYIRKALENRRRHLLVLWAEINNMLDFSLKPHLKDALRNIERQLKKLEEDRERLYLEYSK